MADLWMRVSISVRLYLILFLSGTLFVLLTEPPHFCKSAAYANWGNTRASADRKVGNRSVRPRQSESMELPNQLSVRKFQLFFSALVFCRCQLKLLNTALHHSILKVDPNIELIAYGIRVQHVKSWQDMLPILQARGDLQKFCTEIMMKLGESCCFVSLDIGNEWIVLFQCRTSSLLSLIVNNP